MLKKRQKSILYALIQEYIDTAVPVASKQIVEKYLLPYSSATVRNELAALDEAGLIEQPHTSAGRVPTDKGYRLFIEERITGETFFSDDERTLLKNIFRIREDDEFLKSTARMLSEVSECFALAGLHGEELFYKTGLSEMLKHPEFHDQKALEEFGGLADFIDEEMSKFFDPGDLQKPVAFIGGENPIKEARNYGMIILSVATPKKKGNQISVL